jgi:hypothetical protein
MRIVVFCSFLLFPVFSGPALSQRWRPTPYEIFSGLGAANYFGDIGGTDSENDWLGLKNLDIARSRPGFVMGVRYFPYRRFAVNGTLSMGWLSGTDEGWRNENRGYIFNTAIVEPSGRIEYYPMRDETIASGVNRRGLRRIYPTFSGYVFAGAGAAFYMVSTNDLLEARQEREGIRHGMVTMVLPAGFGVKFGINQQFYIGFESGVRYTFSDYLDGFSTSLSKSNDWYYLTTLQVVYKLQSLTFRD